LKYGIHPSEWNQTEPEKGDYNRYPKEMMKDIRFPKEMKRNIDYFLEDGTIFALSWRGLQVAHHMGFEPTYDPSKHRGDAVLALIGTVFPVTTDKEMKRIEEVRKNKHYRKAMENFRKPAVNRKGEIVETDRRIRNVIKKYAYNLNPDDWTSIYFSSWGHRPTEKAIPFHCFVIMLYDVITGQND
jgi:hypothetical protein